MESLRVIPNVDRGVPDDITADLPGAPRLTNAAIIGIPNGTAAGLPAIVLIARDEVGDPYVLETTLALLESAAHAIRAACQA